MWISYGTALNEIVDHLQSQYDHRHGVLFHLAPLPMVMSAMFVIVVAIEMVIAIIPGMAAVVITVVINAPRGRETYNE
jgi:hypothetical protein